MQKMSTSKAMLVAMTFAASTFAPFAASAVEKTYRQDNVSDPILAIDYADPGSAAMIPYTAPTLAFAGVTLDSFTNNCQFVGYRKGETNGFAGAGGFESAQQVTCVDTDGDGKADKIVMQFIADDSGVKKGGVVELTNGSGGVYAVWLYSVTGAGSGKVFSVNGTTGEVTVTSGTASNYADNPEDMENYNIWGLHAVPRYVPQSRIRLWTKKGGVLTLNDLSGATFTAQIGGSYINSGGFQNVLGQTVVKGLNTREIVDANGDITAIVTEFQKSGGNAVIVKFTNGEDGVYGQVLAARYNLTFGYVYYKADNSYNGNNQTVATSQGGTGYGVCDIKATTDTARTYRQGRTYYFGNIDTASPTASTVVPYSSSTLAFSGITLDDLVGHSFVAYLAGGHVGNKQYCGGKYVQITTNETGSATKMVMQFGSKTSSGSTQVAVLQLENRTDGVYAQRIQTLWTTNNDKQYVKLAADGTISYQNISNGGQNNTQQYYLYGLRVFPRFVPSTSIRLFANRGASAPLTLDDLDGASFSAYMAGAYIAVTLDRFSAYNRRDVRDGEGSIKSSLVEFQSLNSGGALKSIITEFTNGVDGVYGRVLKTFYLENATELGRSFVNTYTGSSITYASSSGSPTVATSYNDGQYGIYDVQAMVEQGTVEWTLDQDRTWSHYTGGVPFDDDTATIRIKVTGDSPTLTIDENVTVGRLVFENARGGGISTNTIVVSAAGVSVGEIELGENVRVAVPTAYAQGAVTLGSGATIAYSGDATVSGAISGDGCVEVASGRVTFSGSNRFSGGLVVKSGAVAVAGAAAGENATSGSFGAIDGRVTVESGGMVDVNGKNGLSYRYTLAGSGVAMDGVAAPGPIVNLGGALDIGSSNWNKAWTTWHAREFTLAGDVTIGVTGYDFGVVSYSTWETARQECYLNLGNHALTKSGSGVLWLWAGPTSVSGTGTLNIESGVVDVRKGKYTGLSSRIEIGANGTLRNGSQVEVGTIVNNGRIEIVPYYHNYGTGSLAYTGSTLAGAYSGSGEVAVLSGGKLTLTNDLAIADFVNGGTVSGTGTITVTGTLTAGNAIPKLTLADGATVKLTGTNAVQSVTGTFASAGRVNVDFSAISANDIKAAKMIPVLSAPSLPADIKRRLSAVGTVGRSFRVVTEGDVSTVYCIPRPGFMVIVK